jgi:hypothetical protein
MSMKERHTPIGSTEVYVIFVDLLVKMNSSCLYFMFEQTYDEKTKMIDLKSCFFFFLF